MSNGVLGARHTRRSFLDVLTGVTVVGWLGSILYPVLRYLKPLPQAGPTGPTRLTQDEVAALERDSFVIVPASNKRVLVFQDAQLNLRALDAKCTHEGCTVKYVPGESLIWCACHNARFDTDGRVLSGPPPRPLPRYTAARDDDGSVVVDLRERA
ncbi:MAG: ubiquinol-cytochrome c reductase iron-sulfur subunit [Candidatus Binatia bacterium]